MFEIKATSPRAQQVKFCGIYLKAILRRVPILTLILYLSFKIPKKLWAEWMRILKEF